MDEINTRFKELRKTLNLSQKSLGDSLGLSSSGISNIENGTRNVTDKHIKLLNAAFGIREHWLRTGEGAMYAENESSALSQVTNLLNLDGTEQKFLAAYLNLSPDARKNLKDACCQIVEFYKAQDEVSATIAARPAASDSNVTREEVHRMIDAQFDDAEKGQTSSVSTTSSGLGEKLA